VLYQRKKQKETLGGRGLEETKRLHCHFWPRVGGGGKLRCWGGVSGHLWWGMFWGGGKKKEREVSSMENGGRGHWMIGGKMWVMLLIGEGRLVGGRIT